MRHIFLVTVFACLFFFHKDLYAGESDLPPTVMGYVQTQLKRFGVEQPNDITIERKGESSCEVGFNLMQDRLHLGEKQISAIQAYLEQTSANENDILLLNAQLAHEVGHLKDLFLRLSMRTIPLMSPVVSFPCLVPLINAFVKHDIVPKDNGPLLVGYSLGITCCLLAAQFGAYYAVFFSRPMEYFFEQRADSYCVQHIALSCNERLALRSFFCKKIEKILGGIEEKSLDSYKKYFGLACLNHPPYYERLHVLDKHSLQLLKVSALGTYKQAMQEDKPEVKDLMKAFFREYVTWYGLDKDTDG